MVVSGKDGATRVLCGDKVLADGLTLNVNSLLFGIGREGEVMGGEVAGELSAEGGAAGTKGGDCAFCDARTGRCGRETRLEGLKPGG